MFQRNIGCPFPEQWVARPNDLGTMESAEGRRRTVTNTDIADVPQEHRVPIPGAMGRKTQRSRHDGVGRRPTDTE
jgi:hypothetical protein